jgi:hypothetical protein
MTCSTAIFAAALLLIYMEAWRRQIEEEGDPFRQ